MSDAVEDAMHDDATPEAKHEASALPDEVSATTSAVSQEAPGGPKRAVKGPRAVRGPGTGLAASLALVVLLVIVIAWTRC